MNKENWEEFKKLEDQLYKCDGWKWEQRLISNLGTSLHIFRGNRFELCKIINWYEKGEESFVLMDVKNRDKLDHFLRDIVRLYHNYLASVSTLIDHTRIICEEFEKEGSPTPKYREKISNLFNTPETNFTQQSRNYMLHAGCIFTGSLLTYEKNHGTNLYLTFSLKRLKNDFHWNASSKKFINAQSKDPKLLPLIEHYSHRVDVFYKWYIDEMTELYKKEISEMNEIKEKMAHFLSIS